MRYHNENFNGTFDFRSKFHQNWRVELHLHEYSEILYCKKGNGYVTVNAEVIPMKGGEMVWIPPNYIHQYDFDCADVICAVFSNDFIPLFFKELGSRYFCVSAMKAGQLSEILESFPRLDGKDTLRISGYLNLIGATVMKQAGFEAARRTDGILYQKVISYISAHYMEGITLSQVAKVFGYNEKYLSHSLHDLTGIHFRQLLNFYRIDRAKKLLTESPSANIGAIAMECGFGALNTFNREFKRIVGMTPREYRRFA
ncbi:MAG: helix-turn-helix transcriptional regulator [Clostridia bacterium]|nr:helix-turn-helix transcriptional regulator [Clostridia bacterium]